MNLIVLGGNLTSKPEIETTASGVQKTAFSIGVHGYAGGEKTTTFFRCTAFGTTATAISKFCSKGDYLIVRGNVNVYKPAEKPEIWSVTVNEVDFTKRKKED